MGGGGGWDVGMIFIDCQQRNTLVNIYVSTALHELSEILNFISFLSISRKLDVYKLGGSGGKGKKMELWKI